MEPVLVDSGVGTITRRLYLLIGVARHPVNGLTGSFNVRSDVVDCGAKVDEAVGGSLPVVSAVDQVIEAGRQGLVRGPDISEVGAERAEVIVEFLGRPISLRRITIAWAIRAVCRACGRSGVISVMFRLVYSSPT